MLTALALGLVLSAGPAVSSPTSEPARDLRLVRSMDLEMPPCRTTSPEWTDCGGMFLGVGPRADRFAVVRRPEPGAYVDYKNVAQIWDSREPRMLREIRLPSAGAAPDDSVPSEMFYEIILPESPDLFFLRAFAGNTYASKFESDAFTGEAIAFTPFLASDDSKRFATSRRGAGWRCWVDVFDNALARLATLEALFGSSDECSAHPIDFSADGARLALIIESFDDDVLPEIQVWDVASKTMLQAIDAEVAGLSNDGRKVAAWTASDSEGQPSGGVVDLATGDQLAAMTTEEAATALSWSPDDRYVVAGGEDGPIQLWDATTGREVRRFDDPDGGPCAIAPWLETDALQFSPDGATLFASCKAGMRVYDVASGAMVRAFTYGEDGLSSVALSPDRSAVAVIRRKGLKDLVEVWSFD